jgi:uncharacterized membrane protein HdeD (DUF308 family)
MVHAVTTIALGVALIVGGVGSIVHTVSAKRKGRKHDAR